MAFKEISGSPSSFPLQLLLHFARFPHLLLLFFLHSTLPLLVISRFWNFCICERVSTSHHSGGITIFFFFSHLFGFMLPSLQVQRAYAIYFPHARRAFMRGAGRSRSKRISSFNPLRKQLSVCTSESHLSLLDKASNYATVEVCFILVKASMGSL
ncbi:hypothetical protein I3843_06G001800 [Carya illinoinensis]|nr:hypothetical protein I3843_06G001800 [Carya illinoinensis]